MVTAAISLTDEESHSIRELARQTGKSEAELIHEAIEQLVARFDRTARLALIRPAHGIWRDRDDLPSPDDLRAEWNRF